jgi:hypothetical protein
MYRVRFWTPPPAPHFARLVDEWDVTDAEQVTDVLNLYVTARSARYAIEDLRSWPHRPRHQNFLPLQMVKHAAT